MTEEREEDQSAPRAEPTTWDQLTHTSDWHGAPDSTLAMMADLADSTSTGMAVTLIVHAGLISGQVVSAQDYFAEIATRLRADSSASGDDKKTKLGDDYAGIFDRAAERVTDSVKADRLAFDKGEVPPAGWPLARYIHLSNARFTVPATPSFELGHIRVLLSQVVGWTGGARFIGEPPG